MIYKNDLLNKNSVNIISYNYQEYNGFSQETAVESIHGKHKEHKFLILVEDQFYEILLKQSKVTSHYAAMEDEFVNIDDIVSDDDVLTIKKIDLNNRYNFELLITIENDKLKNNNQIDDQTQNFINKLIECSNNLGIGLNYREHYNHEDDFCNTYPDRENQGISTISDNVLFINDNEVEYFNQYLLITDQNKSKEFVENLEDKIEKEKNELEIKEYNEKREQIKILVDKYNNYEQNIRHLLLNMESIPQSVGFTIEEITNEINKTEEEIKPLKQIINLYEKRDEPYEEEEILMEKEFKVDYLKELIKFIPEQKKIEEELLNALNSDVDLIKKLLESFHYYDYHNNSYEKDVDLNSEDCQDNESTKPRSLEERFKSIKTYIDNQISYDILPTEFKTIFGIPNKSVSDFLADKIQYINSSQIINKEFNKIEKRKYSPK